MKKASIIVSGFIAATAVAFALVNAPSGPYITVSNCVNGPSYSRTCNVTLNWTDNSNNETGFEVFYSIGGVTGSVTLPPNSTSVTGSATGYNCSTTVVNAQVRALNGSEVSDWAVSSGALVDGNCSNPNWW